MSIPQLLCLGILSLRVVVCELRLPFEYACSVLMREGLTFLGVLRCFVVELSLVCLRQKARLVRSILLLIRIFACLLECQIIVIGFWRFPLLGRTSIRLKLRLHLLGYEWSYFARRLDCLLKLRRLEHRLFG